MSGEKKTLELDKYEYGVIFHALKDERNQMIKEGRPSDASFTFLLINKNFFNAHLNVEQHFMND